MKNKKDKKAIIVSSAIAVIKEKGFEKTSVSDIVKEANVAQGTFYIYFKSKNEIVPYIAQTILEDQLNRIKEQYEKSTDSIDSLIEILIEVTYQITSEYKDLINFCYSGLAYFHSFEIWEEIYKPYYLFIERKLKALKERGELQTENDTVYLSNYLVGIIEHGAESYYLSKKDETLEKSKSELKLFLSKLLLKEV